MPFLFLLVLPATAQAQDILGVILLLSLLPLLNLVLALLYALLRLSAAALLLHAGLAAAWVILFWLFASWTDSDFLAWLPFGLSGGHSAWLLYACVRRLRAAGHEPRD